MYCLVKKKYVFVERKKHLWSRWGKCQGRRPSFRQSRPQTGIEIFVTFHKNKCYLNEWLWPILYGCEVHAGHGKPKTQYDNFSFTPFEPENDCIESPTGGERVPQPLLHRVWQTGDAWGHSVPEQRGKSQNLNWIGRTSDIHSWKGILLRTYQSSFEPAARC